MEDPNDDSNESLKIISKKALADYKRAEKKFIEFLSSADVWSQEEVTSKIIDFHLVEKCRTKFRAFVRGYGAKVKFDPVDGGPRKQEYHGTVTVTRACKQQFLSKHPQIIRAGKPTSASGDTEDADAGDRVILQCAAPTPITTGAQHIPYSPEDGFDGCGRLPPHLQDVLTSGSILRGQNSTRDTLTGAPGIRNASNGPYTVLADINLILLSRDVQIAMAFTATKLRVTAAQRASVELLPIPNHPTVQD